VSRSSSSAYYSLFSLEEFWKDRQEEEEAEEEGR